jgi:16S rRNA (guanine527-N7)-methyltransferase
MKNEARVVRDWADSAGLFGSEEQWRRLETVVGLVQRYGKIMNLSADLRASALWSHVHEGLVAVRALELAGISQGRWLDLGSGGGFPGLVFASWLESVGVLVEPRQKRCDFLRLALGSLGARLRVDALRARLVERGWEVVEGRLPGGVFDWVSARAVFDPETWLKLATRLVGEAGCVVVHGRAGWSPSVGWRIRSSVLGDADAEVFVVERDE